MTLKLTISLRILAATLLASVALISCDSGDPTQPTTTVPEVSRVEVAANPNSALSARVTFKSTNAVSARVWYQSTGSAAMSTPFYPITGDSGQIFALGLTDTTTYYHTVEVVGPGGAATSASVSFKTGSKPDTLEHFGFTTTGTSSGGYTLTALRESGYVVAFDGDGRICWYRHVPGLVSRHVKQLENGNYSAFVGWTTGFDESAGEYVEFTPDGAFVRSHKATAPLYTDNHDIIVTGSSETTTAHFVSYYHKTVDMTAYGGYADAKIAGHQIKRFVNGVEEFSWDGWDHFTIDDWIEAPDVLKTNASVGFDHPNSLAIDRDGHYIVSWRHLAEVSKINSQTGAFIWRLGGRNNQFTFNGDTFGDFNGQHTAQILGNGNVLLFDNGLRHNPPESRAVEYALDTVNMTATQVWEFRQSPPIYTPFVGLAQRLANGNTIVGFGWAATVVEVGPSGNVVWEGHLTEDGVAAPFYRGMRIESLYP